ncbi:transposase [Thiomicrorhabdus sp. Milos-T2]|uniref:transposase n=1 Tax=Thiomicrorhabdus sp. Milos-T2 TaxID=90814 RepID=UPI000A0212DB
MSTGQKHQTKLNPEIDQKVLGLYTLGTSYRDIRFHIEELYGIEISEYTISAVTYQLIPEVKACQSRPLDGSIGISGSQSLPTYIIVASKISLFQC